jgi:chromosome segregation ATPase
VTGERRETPHDRRVTPIGEDRVAEAASAAEPARAEKREQEERRSFESEELKEEHAVTQGKLDALENRIDQVSDAHRRLKAASVVNHKEIVAELRDAKEERARDREVMLRIAGLTEVTAVRLANTDREKDRLDSDVAKVVERLKVERQRAADTDKRLRALEEGHPVAEEARAQLVSISEEVSEVRRDVRELRTDRAVEEQKEARRRAVRSARPRRFEDSRANRIKAGAVAAVSVGLAVYEALHAAGVLH